MTYYNPAEVEFEKDIKVDVSTEVYLDFITYVDLIKDIDVNVAVDQHVYLTGNTANVQFDVEAVGNNTLAEFDVAVLVTDGFSSITGSAFAAVA